MAEIRPFRGVHYASDLVPLAEVLGANPEGRHHAHHFLHLVDPEVDREDRSKYVRFARSAAKLHQLRREGVLVVDTEPSFYLWQATEGSSWLYARVRLEEFEPTGASPADREECLRLLEATRSYLTPIPLLSEANLGNEATSGEVVLSLPEGELKRVHASELPPNLDLKPFGKEPRLDAALAFRKVNDANRDRAENFGLAAIAVSGPVHTEAGRNTYTGGEPAEPISRPLRCDPPAGLVFWCLGDV